MTAGHHTGWALSRCGKLEGETLEGLIKQAAPARPAASRCPARSQGHLQFWGDVVVNYVSIMERIT